ncbi:MAG: serine hydrolase, partial [Candidatus Margulisiibacteriota bacterium]
LETNRELQVNGRWKFPAASVAKVPVMATAYHLAEVGALDLDKKIVFKETDKLPGSGVLRWMPADREYSIRNLIRLMIVLSDNTATKMVVDQLGCKTINNYLNDKLSLRTTRVIDDTMLNEPTSEAANLTSPADMAYLIAMIQRKKGFGPESSEQMLNYMKNQRYRWGLWRGVPRGVKIANKTGNLDGVLNDVGVIYSPAGTYILSIFTYGIEKNKKARELINQISSIVYQTYTNNSNSLNN